MKNIYLRTITGFFFVALMIAAIFVHPLLFAFVFMFFTVFGTWEFYEIVEKLNLKPQKITGTLLSALLFISGVYFSRELDNFAYLLLILPAFFLVFVSELFRNTETPFQNIAVTLLGIIYVGVPFASINFFQNPNLVLHGFEPWLTLGFFVILWAHDTFAYLTGMWLGKHKLYERISPKKTWEGSIGGLVFALITSVLMHTITGVLELHNWLIIAVIITVFGALGDLSESQLKRSAGIKDSGTILPGHGGILDRFDAALMSIPFVLIYILLFI